MTYVLMANIKFKIKTYLYDCEEDVMATDKTHINNT